MYQRKYQYRALKGTATLLQNSSHTWNCSLSEDVVVTALTNLKSKTLLHIRVNLLFIKGNIRRIRVSYSRGSDAYIFKNLQKRCANSKYWQKILQQMCINHQNAKNIVSQGHFAENLPCLEIFSQDLSKQCKLDSFCVFTVQPIFLQKIINDLRSLDSRDSCF